MQGLKQLRSFIKHLGRGSQKEISKRSGIPEGTFSHIATGKRTPTLEHVVGIYYATGIRPELWAQKNRRAKKIGGLDDYNRQ